MITIKSEDGMSNNIEILDESGNNLLATLGVVSMDLSFRVGAPVLATLELDLTRVDVVVEGNITVTPKDD